jgi:hypothetical protein
MLRVIALALFASIVAAGQEPSLGKLVEQAARVRKANRSEAFQATAAFKATLREWIEARLPVSHAGWLRSVPQLQSTLTDELAHAGLLLAGNIVIDNPCYVRVEIYRPPADPNRLAIIAGVTLGCGLSDSVYVYDYSHGARRRVLESNGSRQHDETVLNVYSSTADAAGSRLFLILRFAAQCGSSWNWLAYDLFRLTGGSAQKIFGAEHSIWFGGGQPRVHLKPDDLRIELRDSSIDAGIHNRAHVLHYRVGLQAVQRVDPVALRPQDFVEEWLTRPWAEMESRTAASYRGRLKKWHNLLHTKLVFGEYVFVQKCTARVHDWQIAINMTHTAATPSAPTVYFLVYELGQQRYEMMDVSSTRQHGCPGESPPKWETAHDQALH